MNKNRTHSPAVRGSARPFLALPLGLLVALAPRGWAEGRAGLAADPARSPGAATNAPAGAGGVQVSAGVPHPGPEGRMNREALEESVARGARALTPETSGGALRYLWHRPGWRGVWDLVDPRAPVRAASAPTPLREAVPVAFRDPYRDPASHEARTRAF